MIQNVRKLFIILGNQCNLNCRYCIQHEKHATHLAANISPAFWTYLQNLTTTQTAPLMISFFGGEPLLYWNALTKIVKKLKEMPKTCPIDCGIVTNGKLLSKPMVEFINENNLSVGVSWDGQNVQKTRGYDVLADRWNVIRHIDSLGVDGVLSSHTLPKDWLDAVKPYYNEYEKLHGHKPWLHLEELKDNQQNCLEFRNFDYGELKNQVTMIIQAGMKKSNDIYGHYGRLLLRRYSRLYHTNPDVLSARCDTYVSMQNIDLDGNLYFCHNDNLRIGRAEERYSTIVRRGMLQDPTYETYHTLCKDCSVRGVCRGGCPLTPIKDKKDYFCKMQHAIYDTITESLDKDKRQ